MKTFDWQRALRAGQKMLTTLGGMWLFAWLPAQQGWYIGVIVAGIVPVFGILYKMERGSDAGSSDKACGSLRTGDSA